MFDLGWVVGVSNVSIFFIFIIFFKKKKNKRTAAWGMDF